MTAAPSAPGGWQWRPIAEAPQQLRDAASLLRGKAGEYRTRLCHLYDYERREHSTWAVLLDGDGGTVSRYLSAPLPEPEPPPTEPGTRSLDAPTRSAADAALDVAVRALRCIAEGGSGVGRGGMKQIAKDALRDALALCPKAGAGR